MSSKKTQSPAFEKPTEEEIKQHLRRLEHDTINQVIVDGMVILQIIKHSSEMFPDVVSGIITGVATGSKIEVTNSFAIPTDDDESLDLAHYINRSYLRLKASDCDWDPVGVYVSSKFSDFITEKNLNTLCENQRAIQKFTFLVYDPSITAQGILNLKAYKLAPAFLQLDADNSSVADTVTKTKYSGQLFEEVPLIISNADLIQAYLLQLRENDYAKLLTESVTSVPSTASETGMTPTTSIVSDSEFDSLSLQGIPHLTRTLELMSYATEDIASEDTKFMNFHRLMHRHYAFLQKKAATAASAETPLSLSQYEIREPPQEPSCFKSVLLHHQLVKHAETVDKFASDTTLKLNLIANLHSSLKGDDESGASPSPSSAKGQPAAPTKPSLKRRDGREEGREKGRLNKKGLGAVSVDEIALDDDLDLPLGDVVVDPALLLLEEEREELYDDDDADADDGGLESVLMDEQGVLNSIPPSLLDPELALAK